MIATKRTRGRPDRPWLVLTLAALVLVPSVIAVQHTLARHEEVATTWLTVPVLALTAVTAYQVLPRRAWLEVDKPERRIATDDVIFYIHTEQEPSGTCAVPRDVLINNIPIALINTGGRKAVVSDAFGWLCDTAGNRIDLPMSDPNIFANMLVSTTRYEAGPAMHNELRPPPYVLEPDDVLLLQFRARPYVSWIRDLWDLDRLRELHNSLERPVVSLNGTIVWRRGRDVVRSGFSIPVNTVQQDEYRQLLAQCTQDFTTMPNFAPRTYTA